MQKIFILLCFLFAFHFCSSAQSRALMLLNKQDLTKLIIEEKTFITIKLMNNDSFQGDLFFSSDSTINIEETNIPINSIKYIKTEKAKKAIGFLVMGVGVPLAFIGIQNTHISITGDGAGQKGNSFIEKNSEYFFCSGCSLSLIGSIMVIAKLFNRKYNLQNNTWSALIVKPIFQK